MRTKTKRTGAEQVERDAHAEVLRFGRAMARPCAECGCAAGTPWEESGSGHDGPCECECHDARRHC